MLLMPRLFSCVVLLKAWAGRGIPHCGAVVGCGWPELFSDYLIVSLDYLHCYTSGLCKFLLIHVMIWPLYRGEL
jgi:hypothetical protein